MSKKKHKRLRQKRKACNKHKKARLGEQTSHKRHYMFQEFLINCDDALSLMVPADGRIYRLAHQPNKELDIYPTALWDYDTLVPKTVDIPQTIPADSSLEDQQQQLREYTPSFNVSAEGAIRPFINRLTKMKTSQQILNFKTKKGSHIFAYDVCQNDGLMWIEDDGHVSLLPYEDFSLESSMVEDFTPIPIENFIKTLRDERENEHKG